MFVWRTSYLNTTKSHEQPLTNSPKNAKTTGCEAGKYSGEAAPICTGCEAGKYSSTEGATSESTCIECGAGTYSAAIAAAAESACQGENQLQQLQQIPPVIESNLSSNLTYHSSVQTP